MTARTLLLIFLLQTSFIAQAFADTILIHAGKVLAVPGEEYLTEQTIRIEDGRITALEAGYTAPKETETRIDLTDYYVLPGLIDSHVHITSERSPTSQLKALRESEIDAALFGAANARKTLLAGFTTVQDVGGPNEAVFSLRDAINQGHILGPRIRASGRAITPTGGHGDANGYAPALTELFSGFNTCDGAADCRRAVRETIRGGADLIKITATGGVLSNTSAGLGQQFFDDELKAIVDTAHSMGRKVTAHAHGKEGIEAALRAEVDSIEHGTYLDTETIALFRDYEATLVPTVLAGATVSDWVNEDWLPEPSRKKAAEVGPLMQDMLARAKTGGVNVAFGTDSGVSQHGKNGLEFTYMINAGFSPQEAIAAATLIAAEHLEMATDVGSIEAGKYADIIAVPGDPLSDIYALLQVDFVMKHGKVYKFLEQ